MQPSDETTMKTDDNQKKYITRRQLASRWECSVMTLKRKENAGLLPFSKLCGDRVRYLLSDIEQIEDQAEVQLCR